MIYPRNEEQTQTIYTVTAELPQRVQSTIVELKDYLADRLWGPTPSTSSLIQIRGDTELAVHPDRIEDELAVIKTAQQCLLLNRPYSTRGIIDDAVNTGIISVEELPYIQDDLILTLSESISYMLINLPKANMMIEESYLAGLINRDQITIVKENAIYLHAQQSLHDVMSAIKLKRQLISLEALGFIDEEQLTEIKTKLIPEISNALASSFNAACPTETKAIFNRLSSWTEQGFLSQEQADKIKKILVTEFSNTIKANIEQKGTIRDSFDKILILQQNNHLSEEEAINITREIVPYIAISFAQKLTQDTPHSLGFILADIRTYVVNGWISFDQARQILFHIWQDIDSLNILYNHQRSSLTHMLKDLKDSISLHEHREQLATSGD